MAYGGFAAIAGAFGGVLAFGIQHAHIAIAPWRVLFIIEGIPSILVGISTILLLPDRPEETKFLNEGERKLSLARMNRGTKADTGRVLNRSAGVLSNGVSVQSD